MTVTLPLNLMAGSSRLAIKASPHGTRSGFAAIDDGVGGSLTFTVLPKPWAMNRASVTEVNHMPGTTTHVTLYELDTIEVITDSSVRDRVAQGLLDTVDDAEGDAYAPETSLLERVRSSGATQAAPAAAASSWEDVIRLALLAKRQRSSFSGGGYTGSPSASLLRLVTQQMFIDEVSRVIDRARPHYQTQAAELTLPRGRFSAQSLAVAIATGRPSILSSFDELTADTDALRIVLAALRVTATEAAPGFLATIAAPLRSRAVGLARRLDVVTVFDRERALLAYRRLVMTPLDRPWKSALDLAAEVLERKAIAPDGSEFRSRNTVVISIYMEKWWEQIVADALRVCADADSVSEQLVVSPPWTGARDGTADLYFALDGRTVLADAKYKLDERMIGSSDSYQLFAYSYTAESASLGKPTTAAVFYPMRADSSQAPGTRSTLARATYPRFDLHLVDVPFPDRDDVLSDISWRSYLQRVASGIKSALTSAASGEA